jgi:hypothetical protein
MPRRAIAGDRRRENADKHAGDKRPDWRTSTGNGEISAQRAACASMPAAIGNASRRHGSDGASCRKHIDGQRRGRRGFAYRKICADGRELQQETGADQEHDDSGIRQARDSQCEAVTPRARLRRSAVATVRSVAYPLASRSVAANAVVFNAASHVSGSRETVFPFSNGQLRWAVQYPVHLALPARPLHLPRPEVPKNRPEPDANLS